MIGNSIENCWKVPATYLTIQQKFTRGYFLTVPAVYIGGTRQQGLRCLESLNKHGKHCAVFLVLPVPDLQLATTILENTWNSHNRKQQLSYMARKVWIHIHLSTSLHVEGAGMQLQSSLLQTWYIRLWREHISSTSTFATQDCEPIVSLLLFMHSTQIGDNVYILFEI